jgi:hypothetical protein
VLNSVVALGLFFVAAAAVGRWIGRHGKPYGAAKVSLHFVLFLLVAAGFIASFYKLQLVHEPKTYSSAALVVLGLTLLTNLVVGVSMASLAQVNPTLVRVHKLSTLVMFLSIAASIVFLAAKM